jgi:hypothetical protein
MASMLRPLYWLIWRDPARRARKLLQFSEVESDGGRDLVRAAELTSDPQLRQRFLAHARDEERHARMFRARGLALRKDLPDIDGGTMADWIAPGERGLDDLRVDDEDEASLLAFIHLSESAAARDFARYSDALGHDPSTRTVFEHILHDEERHMRYSLEELQRVAPRKSALLLWKARLRRLWRAYLRLAIGLAEIISTVLLTLQYFLLLPLFAFFAKRSARMEPAGWVVLASCKDDPPGREFGP